MKAWKVGELAKRTGLTVRTLHHYDEIGLLSPSDRSSAGHRLYSEEDVARLQQIVSLRQLGFGLEEVRACLGRPDFTRRHVVELHLRLLREHLDFQQRLLRRLERISAALRGVERVSVEDLFQTIEEITMSEKYFSDERMAELKEKYYTAEQIEKLEERAGLVGEDRIRRVQVEWQELIAEVRAEMAKGTDPASPKVRELAERWQALILEFTGGDPGITESLRNMYRREAGVATHARVEPGMMEFLAGSASESKP